MLTAKDLEKYHQAAERIASAEIKKGQEVTATTGGKAAVAAAGDYVIGVALNNVSAGGYSRLQLSKYQKAKA